jgi:hypothetical protein
VAQLAVQCARNQSPTSERSTRCCRSMPRVRPSV